MTAFFDLSPLTTSYRPTRSTRAHDRHADTVKKLCARRDDLIDTTAGGSADAPARARRSAPQSAAKKANSADDDGADSDESGRRYSISATSHEGLIVATATGQRARLCVVTDAGEILSGDIALDAWRVAVGAYREFLMGSGHLRVHASAPGVAKA